MGGSLTADSPTAGSLPMVAAALALLLGGLLAVALPVVLRRLPRPAGEPAGWTYATLAVPRFRLATGAAAAGALFAAFCSAEKQWWAAWAALGVGGVALAAIDARTGYLPLRLVWATYAAAAAGIVAGCLATGDGAAALGPVAGSAVAALVGWVLWRFGQGPGFGDVRLVALIGLVAGTGGLAGALWSLAVGGAIGALWGVVRRWAGRGRGAYPFGPALMAGPFVVVAASGFV